MSGAHWDTSFKIHETKKGELLRSVFVHDAPVTAVAVDGEHLVVGSADSLLSVWKAP